MTDGLRQYRTIYIELPRKNGKTNLASAIALYMLCAEAATSIKDRLDMSDIFCCGHRFRFDALSRFPGKRLP